MKHITRFFCCALLAALGAIGTVCAQTPGPIEVSNTSSWTGARVVDIIDAKVKSYRTFTSPAPGYAVSAVVGETTFDVNGNGGLGVGGYFITTLKGPVNPNSMNDGVGVHATARKENAGWAFGMHSDVYDSAPGGVAGGLNIEFPQTVPGNRYIGVNMQPNAQGVYEGVNLQGKVSTAINLQEAEVASLMKISSGSTMWTGNGSPGGGLGTYAGHIRIVIDGQVFHMPVYK